MGLLFALLDVFLPVSQIRFAPVREARPRNWGTRSTAPPGEQSPWQPLASAPGTDVSRKAILLAAPIRGTLPRAWLGACDNQAMTKADLHDMVDQLPDEAVEGAAILLAEISGGRIDPEQAWFWTREWQAKEREADDDLAARRVTSYTSDEDFLAALDERTKPLDADA